MTKLISHFDDGEEGSGVTLRSAACVVFFGSIAVFMYPLIYPILDYILSIVDFAEKPGYGSAVGIFNTFTSNDIFTKDPIIADAPYWDKVGNLYFIYFHAYLLLVGITVVVAILFGLSWVVPTQALKGIVRGMAMAISFCPLVIIWLFTMGMIIYSYYLAWQQWSGSFIGYLDFAILVAAFPVVWAHITSVLIGIWVMAYVIPPSSLAFFGAYNGPSRTLKSFWALILG